MASLKRKRLSLSENYKEVTEVESGTKPLKVAKVLTSPLITMAKRAVKNLDLITSLHYRRYLQVRNYFKTAVSLSRDR